MKNLRMPSWPQYQILDHDQRDQLYVRWCRAQGIEPESEGSGDAFVMSMPNVVMLDQDPDDQLDWDKE